MPKILNAAARSSSKICIQACLLSVSLIQRLGHPAAVDVIGKHDMDGLLLDAILARSDT